MNDLMLILLTGGLCFFSGIIFIKNTLDSQCAVLRERLLNRDNENEVLKQTIKDKENLILELNVLLSDQKSKVAELNVQLFEEKKQADEKLKLIVESEKKFSDTFKALSLDALKSNNYSFLELAKSQFEKIHEGSKTDLSERQKSIENLVKPLKEGLEKVDLKINEIEKSRVGAYATITEQVKNLSSVHLKLQNETANLVNALRKPSVRGRWGEIQLKRVVEIAGMIEYCDFKEQVNTNTDNGRLRPDMIINLPNDKKIVVDSKTALNAYIEAIESKDENEKEKFLIEHARQVRNHLMDLSSKNYWLQFPSAPEFVVLFLPGESFFSAALEKDPELIEFGTYKKVIIATPTTLIAVLKAVAYGWKQSNLAENAKVISEMGSELYERISKMADYFIEMKKGIDKTVESYNKAMGSFESRVLVTARKFNELGIANKSKIENLEPVEKIAREPSSNIEIL